MLSKYLHELKKFLELLKILAAEKNIEAGLVEKDYWIMHVLYGLKTQGFSFEMKGGTSLSKGYKIIHRFSEDIDIQINPPADLNIVTDPLNTKKDAVESRKKYYDWLKENIKIDGIVSIERDTQFDNGKTYNSGGIRLYYENFTDKVEGLKEGIRLLLVHGHTIERWKPLAWVLKTIALLIFPVITPVILLLKNFKPSSLSSDENKKQGKRSKISCANTMMYIAC
jgi:hypothetical protein